MTLKTIQLIKLILQKSWHQAIFPKGSLKYCYPNPLTIKFEMVCCCANLAKTPAKADVTLLKLQSTDI
jgi:hypothetical protein